MPISSFYRMAAGGKSLEYKPWNTTRRRSSRASRNFTQPASRHCILSNASTSPSSTADKQRHSVKKLFAGGGEKENTLISREKPTWETGDLSGNMNYWKDTSGAFVESSCSEDRSLRERQQDKKIANYCKSSTSHHWKRPVESCTNSTCGESRRSVRNTRNMNLKRKRTLSCPARDKTTDNGRIYTQVRRKSMKTGDKESETLSLATDKVDVGLLPFAVGGQHLLKVLDSCSSGKQRSILRVGQQVVFVLDKKLRVGELKFIGATHFSNGDWCGIELTEPCGKNDGSVKGVRYFTCQEKYGIFVHSHKVKVLDNSAVRKICDCDLDSRETTKFSLEGWTGESGCNRKILELQMSGVQVHSNAEFHVSNLGNSCGNESLNKGFVSNIIGHSSPLETNFSFKKSGKNSGSEGMERSFLVNTKHDLSARVLEICSFNRSLSFPKISSRKGCLQSLCFSGNREKDTKRDNLEGQASGTGSRCYGSCPSLNSDAKNDQLCRNKVNSTNCSEKRNSHSDQLSEQNINVGADSDLHRNCFGRDKIHVCELQVIASHLSGENGMPDSIEIKFGEKRKLKETLSLNTFKTKLPDCALEGGKISDGNCKLSDAFLQGKYSSCPSLLHSDETSKSQKKCIDLGNYENVPDEAGNPTVIQQCVDEKSGHEERTHLPSPSCGSEAKIEISTLAQSNSPTLYLWQTPGKSLSLPKLNVKSSENIHLESISAFHDSKVSSWPDLFKKKKIPQITYRSTDDEDDDFSVFPSKAMAYSTEDDMYPSSHDGQISPQMSHVMKGTQNSTVGEKVISYASSRGRRSGPGICYPEGKKIAAEPVNNPSGFSSQEYLGSDGSLAFVIGTIAKKKSSQGKKTEANGNVTAAKVANSSKIKSNDLKTLVPKKEIRPSKLEQLAQSKSKGLGGKKIEQNQLGSKIRSAKVDPKVMKRNTLSAIPGPPSADAATQPDITKQSSVGATFDSQATDKLVSHIPHLMRKTQTQSSAEKNKLQPSKLLTTRTAKEENRSVVSKQSKILQSDKNERKPSLTYKTNSVTPRMTKPDLQKSSVVHDTKKGTLKVTTEKAGAVTPKLPLVKKIAKSSPFVHVAEKEKTKQKTSRDTAVQRPAVGNRRSSASALEKDKIALQSSSSGSVGKVAVKSKTPVLPTSTTDTPRRAGGSLRTPRPITGQTTASVFPKGTEKKRKTSQDGIKPGNVTKPLARTAAKRGTKPVTGAKQSSKLRPPSKLPGHVGESVSVASSDGVGYISGFDSDIDSASVNTDLSEDIQGLLLAHSTSPEPEERDFNKEFPFLGAPVEIKTDVHVDLSATDGLPSHVVKPIPWPTSITAPDILSEISAQKSSVGVQAEAEDDSKMLSDLQNRAKCMEELFKRKREECHKLEEEIECRNWELIGIAILVKTFLSKLQHSTRQVGYLERKLGSTEDELRQVREKCLEEEEDNVKLQTEMMYVRSEHAVAMETLKADHDRMLEKMKFTLQMNHTEEMTLVAEAHMAKLEDMKKHQENEVAKLKEEHEKHVAQVTEKYSDELVEVESKHSHAVEEILEEHQVEIETIKSDYDDETAQLKKRCETLNSNCTSLNSKLRQMEEELQRDVESRIESAITKYKSLPDELESLKVVLELKNEEIKQLRNENAETKMELENLHKVGNRVQKLQHENESLSFVVENKSKLERQISVERDSLRNTLEREVKKVKRLSLENEELQWRLFNSPSPPSPLDTSNTADNVRMNRLSTSSLDFSVPSTINE